MDIELRAFLKGRFELCSVEASSLGDGPSCLLTPCLWLSRSHHGPTVESGSILRNLFPRSPVCQTRLLCAVIASCARLWWPLHVLQRCCPWKAPVCVCASLVPASHGAVIWKAVSTDLNEAQEPGHSSPFLSPSHYQSEWGLKSQAQGRNITLRSSKPEFKSAWSQPPVSFITLTSY